jgi:uncharacterized membrane protein YphA (DoxX/SURF4 family)
MHIVNDNATWSTARKLAFKFFFAWVLIFIGSFSFPHAVVPDAGAYTAPFFERIVQWVGTHILQLQPGYTSALISDSTGFYIHALLTIVYALMVMLAWTGIDRNRKSYPLLLHFFYVLIRYYLALQLFTYGFSKLFKWQFYQPEPNTLFTTVGETFKDLLYWTSMGSSRGYNIFLGAGEVLAGALLLFRRSYRLGTLLALGIVINILAVNLGFNIDVKLYSFFLLVLTLILLSSFGRSLLNFLFFPSKQTIAQPVLQYDSLQEKRLSRVFKLVVILTLFTDGLYPYVRSGNFNDDTAQRPLLHGAYNVAADTTSYNPYRWNRLFIHRQSYFITSDANGNMQDYELQYDTTGRRLLIHDYEHGGDHVLTYERLSDSTLRLQGLWHNDSIHLLLQQVNLQQLPLLQQEFNWTMDLPAAQKK